MANTSNPTSTQQTSTTRIQQLQSHLQSRDNSNEFFEPCLTSSRLRNDIFEIERRSSSLDSRELTYFLDGGKSITERKEELMLLLERDPIFQNRNVCDLSRSEQREKAIQRLSRLLPLLNSQPNEDSRRMLSAFIALIDPGISTRLAVQFSLVLNTMRSQASPELFSECEKQGILEMKNFVGCFAMTEMGHGSFVNGVETTATYCEESEEFIIHTPNLTATKWWIGGAALLATHAVVFAQLIVKGKNYGVKPFLVPIRDPETLTIKSGVSIGDCGHKMGRNGLDNGWIQFSSVRIPRKLMLMKHTKVSKDGQVTLSELKQINYGPLIHGRVSILTSCSETAKLAMTIAIRYGLIRRQFKIKGEQIERQILDYTTHQLRLFPFLAMTFAMQFCSTEISSSTRILMKQLSQIKESDNPRKIEEITEGLKEMHGTTAGLKAFCTWNTLQLIETCRQSLGGHGYSSYSALPSLYSDFAVNVTWEGDNTILTLQTGKYLVSCWNKVKKGNTLLSPGVRYMNEFYKNPRKTSQVKSSQNLHNPDTIIEIVSYIASNLVVIAAEKYQSIVQMTSDTDLAQQESAMEMMESVRSHCQFYLVDRFYEAIKKSPSSLRQPLLNLFYLYSFTVIKEHMGILLKTNYFTPAQSEMIPTQIFQFCKEIRKDALGYVDSFNLSDFIISSPLGFKNANYEQYFEMVQAAPNSTGKPPFFDSTLKSFLHGVR